MKIEAGDKFMRENSSKTFIHVVNVYSNTLFQYEMCSLILNDSGEIINDILLYVVESIILSEKLIKYEVPDYVETIDLFNQLENYG